MAITKRQVLKRLKISQSKMAGIFGMTRGAVSKWPDNEPIPYSRWIELKYKHFPEILLEVPDPKDKKIRQAA